MTTATIWWLTKEAIDVPVGDGWLAQGERDRLAAMSVPKRRADWLLGRWTAKCALRAVLRERGSGTIDHAAIEVRSSADGSPGAFVDGGPAPMALSISHSHGAALCVVGDGSLEVGCDMEKVERRSDAFLDDYFTQSEVAAVRSSGKLERSLAVTLIWSAKESALKALRTGLRADTRSVTIAPFPGGADEWNMFSASPAGDGRPMRGWWRSAPPFVLTALAIPDCAAPAAIHPSVSADSS